MRGSPGDGGAGLAGAPPLSHCYSGPGVCGAGAGARSALNDGGRRPVIGRLVALRAGPGEGWGPASGTRHGCGGREILCGSGQVTDAVSRRSARGL